MTSRKKDMTDRSGSVPKKSPLLSPCKPDFGGKDFEWIIETRDSFLLITTSPWWKLFLEHLVGNQAENSVFLAKSSSPVDPAIQKCFHPTKRWRCLSSASTTTTLAIGLTRSLTIYASPSQGGGSPIEES